MNLEELKIKLLEKEQQMNILMRITQAINANEPADRLFRMYNDFMEEVLEIDRMMFFVFHEGEWVNVSESGGIGDRVLTIDERIVEAYRQMTDIDAQSPSIFAGYDFIIPVWHKEQPIAFVVIKEPASKKYRREFIITLTNIIGVAIENKRLFKRQVEQERYRKEIELASEVQKMLIPGVLPRKSGIEVSSIYKPQLNVGGDYYDFIQIDENKYIFCIADISGKGVGAALLMANFQATLHNALEHYQELDKLVRHLNKLLVRITKSERIITLFIAEYNQKTGMLRYVNAGHTSPYLIVGDRIHALQEGCTLLGAFDDLVNIKIGAFKLEETALLMLYTDGLTDLVNDSGQYFDSDYIQAFLRSNAHYPVDIINDHLLEVLDTFKGEQDYPDDIAVLTCKLVGKS